MLSPKEIIDLAHDMMEHSVSSDEMIHFFDRIFLPALEQYPHSVGLRISRIEIVSYLNHMAGIEGKSSVPLIAPLRFPEGSKLPLCDIIKLVEPMMEHNCSLKEVKDFFEVHIWPAAQAHPDRLNFQVCCLKTLFYMDEKHDSQDPCFQDQAIVHLQNLLANKSQPKWWQGWWMAGLAIRELDFYLGLSCVCRALVEAQYPEEEDWILAQTEVYFQEEHIPQAFFQYKVSFWQEGALGADEFLVFG